MSLVLDHLERPEADLPEADLPEADDRPVADRSEADLTEAELSEPELSEPELTEAEARQLLQQPCLTAEQGRRLHRSRFCPPGLLGPLVVPLNRRAQPGEPLTLDHHPAYHHPCTYADWPARPFPPTADSLLYQQYQRPMPELEAALAHLAEQRRQRAQASLPWRHGDGWAEVNDTMDPVPGERLFGIGLTDRPGVGRRVG